MKIHEYQAKNLLKLYDIPIQDGIVVEKAEDLAATIAEVKKHFQAAGWVIKAQIHAGGRGKGGGVKFSRDADETLNHGKNILGMTLVTPQTGAEGQLVRKVMVAEAVDIARELYVAITLDRATGQNVVVVSQAGGMDIEEVARETPEKIVKANVAPGAPLRGYQARGLMEALGLSGALAKAGLKLLTALYRFYTTSDASIVEINPLVVTKTNELLALDAKVNFDDNALYRHEELAALRDEHEEAASEIEARRYNLNFIKLTGNVGCMVNGAGLAMATMDLIKLKGGSPANFLDVGGTASAETVKQAFRIILADANVKAILINIFGGIVRCDRVAQGVVDAAKELDLRVPVVVRLVGTNAKEAKSIIASSGVKVVAEEQFEAAAERAVELAQAG